MADVKVTIAFKDDGLYRAIRIRAAQSGRQIRDIVEEALEAWLEAREDEEDLAASIEALNEDGALPAEEFFARMVAESRVAYGPDPKS